MNTKQQEIVNKAIAWSNLTPEPVRLYLKEYDEVLVAWNGFLMNDDIALSLTLEEFKKWPTPRMKEHMFRNYKQLYIAGFFGDNQNWDSFFRDTPDRLFAYLRKSMTEHIKKTINGKGISIIKWFEDPLTEQEYKV